jgi:hypothetical protein
MRWRYLNVGATSVHSKVHIREIYGKVDSTVLTIEHVVAKRSLDTATVSRRRAQSGLELRLRCVKGRCDDRTAFQE